MITHSKTPAGELSYYGLSLLSYLRESHPELAADAVFVAERADEAAQTYSGSIHEGRTHTEAEEAASAQLYRGLLFSPYNTLVHIIWDEFAQEIPEEEARFAARLLLPLCGEVLSKYDLTDDFASCAQYNQLYTELVGNIQILLGDGVQ